MEIEAELQPTWIRLQTKTLLAVIRMRSLPTSHPIHAWMSNALRTRTANVRHRSNLESALQQFSILTEQIETIEPFIRPPWWMPKAKIQISTTKDQAKSLHENFHSMSGTEAIYTDGSGIGGRVGAAKYYASNHKVTHQHLGNETEYNVFAAELTALCLAATEIQESGEHDTWNIYVDSQAAIHAVDRPFRQSGQSIIKEFIDTVDEAVKANPELRIQLSWVPGHVAVEGNEIADTEAKKAASDPIAAKPFQHKPLRSTRVQSIKATAKEQWLNEWNNNTKTSHTLRRILRRPGTKGGTKFYNRILNKRAAVSLMRLRTGHCGLNYYLFRFKLSNSPYCPCGHGKETVEHYLIECKLYAEQRKELRKKVGPGRMKVERLLSDPRLAKHTVEYIAATKGLQI